MAARYYDRDTGDLVMLFQPHDSTVVVRVPAAELSDPDCLKRKRRARKGSA